MLVHFASFHFDTLKSMAPHNRSVQSVPVFELYGEQGTRLALDPIHVESIAARSSLHNWEIKPHRHHGLLQLLWLQQGDARLLLDDLPGELVPDSVVLVPQHCVHGFRFAQEAGGLVLTLAYPWLAGLDGERGRRLLALASPHVCRLGESAEREQVHQLLRWIAQEYERPASFRLEMLESLVVALLALLLRQPGVIDDAASVRRRPVPPPASAHLTRFTAEIERSFRTHAPLSHYAAQLGFSVAHLNTLCRQYAGRSALGMVHDRLLLEARRNLAYTVMTVREVAEVLGFADPAYFTRFFRRATGISPSQFRERADFLSGQEAC